MKDLSNWSTVDGLDGGRCDLTVSISLSSSSLRRCASMRAFSISVLYFLGSGTNLMGSETLCLNFWTISLLVFFLGFLFLGKRYRTAPILVNCKTMSQTSDWLSKWANRDPMYPMLGSKWYTHTNRYWFQLPNCKARLNPSALVRGELEISHCSRLGSILVHLTGNRQG